MSKDTVSVRDKFAALSDERAKLLDRLARKNSGQAKTIKRYPRIERDGLVEMPTSWAQQRLWFIDQLEGGGAAYNMRMVLSLRGRLDADALQRSLDSLIERHETLRTVFANVEGAPMQVIRGPGKFAVATIDLRDCERDHLDAHVLLHKLEESRNRFDLSVGPLIRGRLLVIASDEHVLLITMHHIIADGWSTGLFVRELSELYAASQEGRPPRLDPLPIQYADYARWQREGGQAAAIERQLKYWLSQLENVAPELVLPLDRPRPVIKSFRGGTVPVRLDADLISGLNALARRCGMTLFMVLCAGWMILLSRLSGQEDVVIGTPTANRRRSELEGLFGFFVNTLALRVEVAREMSVIDLLMRVKEVTLGAFEHQDVPFEQLVDTLRPPRSLNRHPVFQVMFVLQNTPQSEFALPDLTVTREPNAIETSQFDILLTLDDRGGEVSGLANFDTDLFDASTVERWMASFTVLLRGLHQDDRRRIADLPILPESERLQVLDVFNRTGVAFPKCKMIHDLVRDQARRAPSALAVSHAGRTLTYEALDDKAHHLANQLRSAGVGADRIVGICMERSLEMVVGLLAILKSGSAYLPLDPSYPRERLTYMIDDARPHVVLTQEHLVAQLPATQATVMTLSSNLTFSGGRDDAAAAASDTSPDNLLYLIYTSGSTGQPKGTAMSHRAMFNLIEWHRQSLSCARGTRVLQFAALSFDVAFQEIFSTLCTGGTLVLLDEAVRRDPRALNELLRREAVDRVFIPPLMLQSLAEHFNSTGVAPTSLRDVIVAGEQLRISREIVELFRHLERCRLHNHYGPTEAHVVTALTLAGKPEEWPALPTIGRPIANTQIYILDSERQPVPIGVSGEIYIGGANLAREYLRRPELTAERFVHDPFSADPHARMYKTGDIARWRTDATIECLGRNDDQVKIRGFRVELGEVERQLATCEDVKEAAVMAREDVPGQKQLVAYATLRSQSKATPGDLRADLKSRLPEHMLPSAIVILEALPLTPSGKLNKRALPAPDASAYVRQRYEAPQGHEEQTLATIWEELLGLERVGRNDNFFEVGGHSLLVLKLLFKTNVALSCALQVPDVYRNPTVSELARYVREGAHQDEYVDLTREASLDASLVALRGNPRVPEQTILLTGGTGFVGRFLLSQLMVDTKATLYCLVRARSPEHASFRLRTMLAKWDLWRDEWEPRIVAVPGDLRLPHLGIDPRTHELLSKVVDSIYHCGTSMNHLETYSMAKAANVEAVRGLLRLATSEKPKLLNYISTLGIFAQSFGGESRVVNEASSIDNEKHLGSRGYAASKWVGEKLAMLASQRGIPCNIFRLGLAWADSRRGRYDELQRGYRTLKSCLLSGYGIENFRYNWPPMPVDYASRAIVFLARRYGNGGGIFHISSSKPMAEGLFECCNRVADTPLELLPYYDWICEMRRLHQGGKSLPIVPLIETYFSMNETEFHESLRRANPNNVLVESKATQQELERFGIFAPALNDEWVGLCLKSMVSHDTDLQERRVSEGPPGKIATPYPLEERRT